MISVVLIVYWGLFLGFGSKMDHGSITYICLGLWVNSYRVLFAVIWIKLSDLDLGIFWIEGDVSMEVSFMELVVNWVFFFFSLRYMQWVSNTNGSF